MRRKEAFGEEVKRFRGSFQIKTIYGSQKERGKKEG